MSQGTCSIDGCEKPSRALTLCTLHYQRLKKHGDPTRPPNQHPVSPAIERLMARVNKDGPLPPHRPELGPCWVWTGPAWNGYSTVGIGVDADGVYRTRPGHRVAFEAFRGPIPDGMQLDHLCHNGSGCLGGTTCPHRCCVNPAHLEPVTHAENIRRGVNWLALRTHCVNGHELTPDNIYRKPSRPTVRLCRICNRERKQRYAAAKR